MKRLTVYFDYGSPYSYLAWRRFEAHPDRYAGADVQWVPASAAHIFAQDGSRPNASYPNQLAYTIADLHRWAAAYGAPLVVPDSFPARSIEAGRLHFVAADDGPETLRKWMAAAFEAHWVDGRNIGDAAVLEELALPVGLPGGASGASQPGPKARLIEATQAAYAAGAPGVPFFVLEQDGKNPETFWGNDRMAWVEAHLAGQPVPEHC